MGSSSSSSSSLVEYFQFRSETGSPLFSQISRSEFPQNTRRSAVAEQLKAEVAPKAPLQRWVRGSWALTHIGLVGTKFIISVLTISQGVCYSLGGLADAPGGNGATRATLTAS